MKLFRIATGFLLLGVFLQFPGFAAGPRVDLALVLAVDSSASVSWREFDQQMTGLAEAFEHENLQNAISSGQIGAIGVAVVEWSGANEQRLSVPWTIVSDAKTARHFASSIRQAPRYFERGGTSISGAIEFSLKVISQLSFETGRFVVDISGDGRNSAGSLAAPWRDKAVAAGVVINGLPILNEEADLESHFQQQVIGGEGAFTVVAENYEDYRKAILIKLDREIRGGWFGV